MFDSRFISLVVLSFVSCLLKTAPVICQENGDAILAASLSPFPGNDNSWTSTLFVGMEGSKQPQDFGVNANLGGRVSLGFGIPLHNTSGLGLQFGGSIVSSANAVQVLEIVGETTGRTQSFSTVAIFNRYENGIAWTVGHDFLYQTYYDEFIVSQWRMGIQTNVFDTDQFGVAAMLRGRSDDGEFLDSTRLTLRSINQAKAYWRHFWETGAQTTGWLGIAGQHSEDNAVTNTPLPTKSNQLVAGAEVLMPLSNQVSLYGETNLIFPVDTGTVDAFLGIQWHWGHSTSDFRKTRFNPILPIASSASFSVDMTR